MRKRKDVQDKPQPKRMKIKAKGDGKKRKRENIAFKKAPNLLNPYFGWVLSLYLAHTLKDKKKKGELSEFNSLA